MPRLYRSGNFVIADDGTDINAFPCTQSYYIDTDNVLYIQHDMRGLQVIILDATTWDDAPTGSSKYTLDTMRTFLRDNLMIYGGSPSRFELRNTENTLLDSGVLDPGTLVEIVAPDATVDNSNVSFTQAIPSDTTYTLADYDFEIQDPTGVVLSNNIRPAMVGETFIISTAGICPTTFSYNLKINGVFSQIVTVDIFSDINITIN